MRRHAQPGELHRARAGVHLAEGLAPRRRPHAPQVADEYHVRISDYTVVL